MESSVVVADFERFRVRLLAAVEVHDDVLGLVWVGSAADTGRVDQWSDHDFFLITRPGSQERLRRKLDWLPDHDDIAIAARETAHGLKVVYRDGHVLEFAVASPEELSTFRGNQWEVALDRESITERMRRDVAPARPGPSGGGAPGRDGVRDPGTDLRLFLVNLLIGVGRARRGEVLSAGQCVRTNAVRHLLQAAAGILPGENPDRLDDLDPWRRFESVFPAAGALIAAALTRDVEPCARALLEAAEVLLGDAPAGFPAAEALVVRSRLGW